MALAAHCDVSFDRGIEDIKTIVERRTEDGLNGFWLKELCMTIVDLHLVARYIELGDREKRDAKVRYKKSINDEAMNLYSSMLICRHCMAVAEANRDRMGKLH
jgi:hypothetical protein